MSEGDRNSSRPLSGFCLRRSGLGRRVRDMALLWLGLGGLVGACTTPPGAGLIGVLAFSLAGMIVLPVLGLALGLLGGRVTDTLLGAGFGGMIGALAALALRAVYPLPVVSMGLIN